MVYLQPLSFELVVVLSLKFSLKNFKKKFGW